MKNSRLVIVDGVRTPFCKAGTELASLGADELGRIAVNALLTRTGLDPELVDEVIFGCVAQPADATNVARVIALRAGIPEIGAGHDGAAQLRFRVRSGDAGPGEIARGARLDFHRRRNREHVEHPVFIQATHGRKIQPPQPRQRARSTVANHRRVPAF